MAVKSCSVQCGNGGSDDPEKLFSLLSEFGNSYSPSNGEWLLKTEPGRLAVGLPTSDDQILARLKFQNIFAGSHSVGGDLGRVPITLPRPNIGTHPLPLCKLTGLL